MTESTSESAGEDFSLLGRVPAVLVTSESWPSVHVDIIVSGGVEDDGGSFTLSRTATFSEVTQSACLMTLEETGDAHESESNSIEHATSFLLLSLRANPTSRSWRAIWDICRG